MTTERQLSAKSERPMTDTKSGETDYSYESVTIRALDLLRQSSLSPVQGDLTRALRSDMTASGRDDWRGVPPSKRETELARLREDVQFSDSGKAALAQDYVRLLLDNAKLATKSDVSILQGMSRDSTMDHKELSSIGTTLLQIAGRGGNDAVQQSAAIAFRENSFPGAEDPAFRRALLDYAQVDKIDPMFGGRIRRYAFRLDGEKPFETPSRWNDALVEESKLAPQDKVTDAPTRSRRRDETVRAIEKVMPSYASLECLKTNGKETVGGCIAIDARGYYLTANHVVRDAETITLTNKDGSASKAKVVATIPDQDLAVIKIEKRVPETSLGPAARTDLLLGEKVIAIGSPFGYKASIASGILSNTERKIDVPGGAKLNSMQVDLGINPGNSGGPLINRNGELIGIVCAIRDGAQMMAYVVNADDAQNALSSKMSAERIAGITHGIRCRQVITSEEGNGRQHIVARNIPAESPAGKCGMKEGDIIKSINGKSVMNRFDVERAFWEQRAGTKVAVTVVRDGETIKLELTPTRAGRK